MDYNIFNEAFNEEQLLFNEPMSRYTSFKIGGPADLIVFPGNVQEIKTAVSLCVNNGIPYFVIGKGSNLLVRDNGFRGVIISLSKNYDGIEYLGDCRIRALTGVTLAKLSAFVLEYELSGLEFASGIPGSLGGAVCMNAGAYGGEMKDVVERVCVLDSLGNKAVYDTAQMGFGYRTSILQSNGFIAYSCDLKPAKGNLADIKAKMAELNGRRKEKQPLDIPSAGSTFRRPEGFFAAQLIDDAGLKGYSVGGAMVSEKHGGFVVNFNNATAQDVITLIEHIKDKVYNVFNIELEPEIKIIGD